MNLHGLVIEGIAGTGKSTFLYEFLKSEYWTNKPFISSQVLSEHHTLRALEQKSLNKTWQPSDSLGLLDFHTTHLEELHSNLGMTNWLERDRTNQKLPFIFERFHLTHAYHFKHLTWQDVAPIDDRLQKLNAKLCVFTISPEDIKSRIIDDYKKTGWQDYLKTLGDTDEEIIDHFTAEQEQLLELANKSSLPTLILNTSDLGTNELVQVVTDFYNLY